MAPPDQGTSFDSALTLNPDSPNLEQVELAFTFNGSVAASDPCRSVVQKSTVRHSGAHLYLMYRVILQSQGLVCSLSRHYGPAELTFTVPEKRCTRNKTRTKLKMLFSHASSSSALRPTTPYPLTFPTRSSLKSQLKALPSTKAPL